MFNYSKLRGRMVEKGYSIKSLADKLPFSEWSLGMKLRGRFDFKQSEILAICRLLDIPSADIGLYFFAV